MRATMYMHMSFCCSAVLNIHPREELFHKVKPSLAVSSALWP